MKIPAERMNEVNALYKTPKERAEEINSILQRAATELDLDHSLMDVTCFAVQWIAMLAIGELSADQDFVRIAKLLNIWLYTRHFNAPEEIYGKPDREETDSQP